MKLSIRRTALTLGTMVGIALLLVLSVDRGTQRQVALTQAQSLERRLAEVLPMSSGDALPDSSAAVVRAERSGEALPHDVPAGVAVAGKVTDRRVRSVPTPDVDEPYAPRWIEQHWSGGRAIGIAMSVVAPDGYNGDIELLVGVRPDGTISGVRVTDHRETPGLGDDIERRRSDWITHFDGLSLASVPPSGWAVRRHGGRFDAFSGATITPRAVIDAVHGALGWFARHGGPSGKQRSP